MGHTITISRTNIDLEKDILVCVLRKVIFQLPICWVYVRWGMVNYCFPAFIGIDIGIYYLFLEVVHIYVNLLEYNVQI